MQHFLENDMTIRMALQIKMNMVLIPQGDSANYTAFCSAIFFVIESQCKITNTAIFSSGNVVVMIFCCYSRLYRCQHFKGIVFQNIRFLQHSFFLTSFPKYQISPACCSFFLYHLMFFPIHYISPACFLFFSYYQSISQYYFIRKP